MKEYRHTEIPQHHRNKWLPLIDALIAAEGKALHLGPGEYPRTLTNMIQRQCLLRGVRPHSQRQRDGSLIIWVTRDTGA